MTWFDTVINWGVPLGIVLWLGFLFYIKFKEVFDTMFRTVGGWIGRAFGSVSGSARDAAETGYEVVYTYGR